MEKTVCELFSGVGGFRCGLNHVTHTSAHTSEEWETVWFNQWEPEEKTTQYAHDCYVYHFGAPPADMKGNYTTNTSIEDVVKEDLPDFNLAVGGFPCQDYSVAAPVSVSKGIEGQKGVLWWSIDEILAVKQPAFVLLENVDRLVHSPKRQPGRDFGVILSCFRKRGYSVEWRIINAADYGYPQRRRRTFIFGYRNETNYARKNENILAQGDMNRICEFLTESGFFASTFPVKSAAEKKLQTVLPNTTDEVFDSFSFDFQNSGVMEQGHIYTAKTMPFYTGPQITLGEILETGPVDESFFIEDDELYYTDPSVTNANETQKPLSKEDRHTWQYLKGGKKIQRNPGTPNEHLYCEGAIPMIDEDDKPARTIITSEGSFNRCSHLVRDKCTGRIRLLTAEETERIQGFPSGFTKYCKVGERIIEIPLSKRRFLMGNALVVNLISDMEKTLSEIFEEED